MVDDVEVSSDQLVFQVRPIGDHDLVSLIGDDDTSSSESDTLAEPDVSSDSEVVELFDVGNSLEPFLKVLQEFMRQSKPLQRRVAKG